METFFTNCSKCKCLTTPENGIIKNNTVTCNNCKEKTVEEAAEAYMDKTYSIKGNINPQDYTSILGDYVEEISNAFIAGVKYQEMNTFDLMQKFCEDNKIKISLLIEWFSKQQLNK
jgi:hypothetical protein